MPLPDFARRWWRIGRLDLTGRWVLEVRPQQTWQPRESLGDGIRYARDESERPGEDANKCVRNGVLESGA
jgi:hypothetical protein